MKNIFLLCLVILIGVLVFSCGQNNHIEPQEQIVDSISLIPANTETV